MRIGIDARMYGSQNGGLGRYIEQLIKNLIEIDSKNEYVLFFLKTNIPKLKTVNCKLKIITTNIPWYSWEEQILYPLIINREKIDLMHFPHWNIPLLYNRPFVVTIHDLIMYHYPRLEASTHGPLIYWLKDKLHRLVVNHAVKKARHIIVPSNFTKQDLIQTLKVSSNKINVIYLATKKRGMWKEECGKKNTKTTDYTNTYIVNKKTTNKSRLSHSPFSIPHSPYILYVGNAYPHKNLPKLLEAWKIFCKEYTNKYNLVLVGKESKFYNKLINELNQDNIPSKNETLNQRDYHVVLPIRIGITPRNDIIYLGYQTDEQLSELYQHTSLYIFPSLYEGFGLPPLEAMQYNVPICSSNASCLPEILEDSAIYFSPNSTKEMIRAIHLGLNDHDLREKLRQKTKILLQKYSWEQTALKTLEIYRGIEKVIKSNKQ